MGPAERQRLIDSAVQFLNDPQVLQGGSFERQRSFLESKGLTRDEIDKAMRLAGMTTDSISPPPLPTKPPVSLAKQSIQRPSFDWGKFTILLALIGSTGVAVYQSSIAVRSIE